ncbi:MULTISPECIES: PIG-L deacetylase family protein [unclassified Petrotoga]|uniref:PIG-L deacetylase family protein n=1 Tax=unclassified Petrotoga TaxID=2620614 RepID=UPI001304E93B|nr:MULTISPECIES: PIG-L family deacetylase [unclassified Petrotoga]
MVDALFIGAHPDDYEAFGGGTILRLKKEGKSCGGIILTDGSAGRNNDINVRKMEAEHAAKSLKLDYFEMIGLKDGYLNEINNLAALIANLIRKYRPKILFTHYFEDKHPDHKAVGESTIDALFLARTKREDLENEPYNCSNVLMFISDITKISQSKFFVEITDFLEEKIKVLRLYESQKEVLGPISLMNKYIAADVLEGRNKAVEVFYPLTLVKGEGYYVL